MNNQQRAAELIWDEQAAGIVKSRDLADALADAGLLMPDLPEPYREEGQPHVYATAWNPCYTVLRTDFSTGAATEVEMPVGNVWIEPLGGIGMDTDHSEMYLSTDEARHLALALLAAADYAEKDKDDA